MIPLEPVIGTFAGGGVAGFVITYAVKKIAKIAMVVVGLFFAGMSYLSYKGIATVNWETLNNQTQTAAINTAAKVMDVLNHTSQQIHYAGIAGISGDNALPVSAGAGFLLGCAYGLKKG